MPKESQIPYDNMFKQNNDNYYPDPYPHYMMPLEDKHCNTNNHDSVGQRSSHKENKWLTNNSLRKSREIGGSTKKSPKKNNENIKQNNHKNSHNHCVSKEQVKYAKCSEEVKPKVSLPKKPIFKC